MPKWLWTIARLMTLLAEVENTIVSKSDRVPMSSSGDAVEGAGLNHGVPDGSLVFVGVDVVVAEGVNITCAYGAAVMSGWPVETPMGTGRVNLAVGSVASTVSPSPPPPPWSWGGGLKAKISPVTYGHPEICTVTTSATAGHSRRKRARQPEPRA